jgi:hypothetical protein
MGAQKIILPADSVGKAIHTREITVAGPGVVQQQYVIPISERLNSGVYRAHTGAHVILAAAQNGTSTGFWWLYNTSATVICSLRRVQFSSQHGSALPTPTSPRIMLQTFTFTGTPAGTAIVPAKTDSGFAAATASLRSTQVTSVVTLAQQFMAFLPVAALTAVGSEAPGWQDWVPDTEDGEMLLRQNQGIVCWQADAGTTSDTRRFVTNVAWSEFTIP